MDVPWGGYWRTALAIIVGLCLGEEPQQENNSQNKFITVYPDPHAL